MKLYNGKKPILKNIVTASSFISRFLGLMGRSDIPPGFAMYFPDCNSIHTFFMKTKIDVIMANDKGRVMAIYAALEPWKMTACLKAKDTYEFKAGEAARLKIKKGDVLRLV